MACTNTGNPASKAAESLAIAAERMLQDCAPTTFSPSTCVAMRLHRNLVELEAVPAAGKYERVELYHLYVRSSLGQPSEGRVIAGLRYSRRTMLITVDFRDEGDGWAAYTWEAGDLGPMPDGQGGWVTWSWSAKLSERP